MTQFIETTPGAIAAAMGYQTQAPQSNYGTGQLGFAEGGLASLPRGGYMGGGSIGGGIIHGTPMGSRTGYWNPFKAAKKAVKKLIPKELAGVMQIAAPFVAPHSLLGAGLMSGLGQYKSKGKISPLQLMMSMAPGVRGEHLSKIGLNKAGGIGAKENVLRNLMGRVPGGEALDKTLFGSVDKPQGWLGKNKEYGGIQDILSRGAEKIFMKGPEGARELDKMAVISAGLAGLSYWEAKEQIQLQNGIDLEEDLGITEDTWEATDWTDTFKYAPQVPKAHGGRASYAMGSAQFPPNRRVYADGGRTGLQWGSDKGEGLGGQEVEADMRYEGGFMPYGEEPKADDVPARLSKDEFVFTDQAVAGAGEGDVELGAERLYNVMKNLESGGRLSEESQGEMGEGIGAII